MIHKNDGQPLDDQAAYKHLTGRLFFYLTNQKPDPNYFVQPLLIIKLLFGYLAKLKLLQLILLLFLIF